MCVCGMIRSIGLGMKQIANKWQKEMSEMAEAGLERRGLVRKRVCRNKGPLEVSWNSWVLLQRRPIGYCSAQFMFPPSCRLSFH